MLLFLKADAVFFLAFFSIAGCYVVQLGHDTAGFPPGKNLWGGGGQLENTNLLKKGICLLNTFLKDFTKMPIKKNTVLQFDGGISPLAKIMRGIKPPHPLCMKPCTVHWATKLSFDQQRGYNLSTVNKVI